MLALPKNLLVYSYNKKLSECSGLTDVWAAEGRSVNIQSEAQSGIEPMSSSPSNKQKIFLALSSLYCSFTISFLPDFELSLTHLSFLIFVSLSHHSILKYLLISIYSTILYLFPTLLSLFPTFPLLLSNSFIRLSLTFGLSLLLF